MIKTTQIAASVAAAFALGYGATASAVVGAPGAVAEAGWTQTNFTVCAGDGALNAGGSLTCGSLAAPVIVAGAVLSGNGLSFGSATQPPLVGGEQAGATARVNAVSVSNNPPATNLGAAFTVSATVGAGFTPGVPLPAVVPTGQYAGGISASSGFSLSPTGANVLLHSQVQVNSFGSDASGSSQQTLNSTFGFSTQVTQTFELSWDGTIFRRAGIGQTGGTPATNFASADQGLSFSLIGITVGGVGVNCSWSPSGALNAADATCTGGGSSGVEFADAFSYDTPSGISVFTADFPFSGSGYFEAEFTIPAGFYSFTIGGQTQADAAVFALVPEPHSLALLGLGLLGLGFAARRKTRA